jgi:hypothetical protein
MFSLFQVLDILSLFLHVKCWLFYCHKISSSNSNSSSSSRVGGGGGSIVGVVAVVVAVVVGGGGWCATHSALAMIVKNSVIIFIHRASEV